MSELEDAIPAATLVLMRERRGAPPELLLIERTGNMAFAAGALVFPGGRIDPGDREAAAAFAAFEDAAARIAAVRETIEETGLAPAVEPVPDEATALMLRQGIERGDKLPQLLAERGLTLRLDALTPFARWCPNFRETRRFDTLFFLAEVPEGAADPVPDEREAARAFWASAAESLAEIDAGRSHAIFPTRRNLERLARFGSIAEARADAALHPVSKITPWVEERGGSPHVCIPDGLGYPVTSEPLATARRR
ncbi:MAG TPA: NUDIX domain-containing protein [Allosphingosinicella sp.]|jgi:8-oxo-dGTP pyrophosphatase MutT (NUDIX family)